MSQLHKVLAAFMLFLVVVVASSVNAASDSKNATAYANVTQVNSGVLPPTDLMAYVMTDGSKNAFLNWTQSGGADGYRIYYLNDNVTACQLLNLTHGAPNVTLVGASNNTWNDTTANLTMRRFYVVSAYSGANENFSTHCVGRQNVEIRNITNGGEQYTDMFSFQLNNTASLVQSLSAPNNLAYFYYTYFSPLLTISFRSWFNGNWYNSGGGIEDLALDFSSGFYTQRFLTRTNFTCAGKVEAGAVNQTVILNDDNYFGIETFSNVSLSSAIPTTNNFAFVYFFNSAETLDYRSYFGGQWYNSTGGVEDLTLTSDSGYISNHFTTNTNMSYVRNPF